MSSSFSYHIPKPSNVQMALNGIMNKLGYFHAGEHSTRTKEDKLELHTQHGGNSTVTKLRGRRHKQHTLPGSIHVGEMHPCGKRSDERLPCGGCWLGRGHERESRGSGNIPPLGLGGGHVDWTQKTTSYCVSELCEVH